MDVPHAQTFVKVNAPVDSGIAPLVSALSRFPGLVTLSSCEGGAFVTFRIIEPLNEAAAFFCWLSRQLVVVADDAELSARWGGGDSLIVTLRCGPNAIKKIVRIIRRVARNADRNNRCIGFGSSRELPELSDREH